MCGNLPVQNISRITVIGKQDERISIFEILKHIFSFAKLIPYLFFDPSSLTLK